MPTDTRHGLHLASPITTANIPPSTAIPIPLRNLASAANRRNEASAASGSPDGNEGRRRSADSAGSEFSLWSDTGDLAEQLANEEDPLQIKLRDSSDHQLPRGRGLRSEGSRQKHVHYEEENLRKKPIHPGVDKEAIQIPEPEPRSVGRVERYLAKLMTGNRQGSNMHGLTGKPLLYVVRINSRSPGRRQPDMMQVFYKRVCVVRSVSFWL